MEDHQIQGEPSHAQRLPTSTDIRIIDILVEDGFGSVSRFSLRFTRSCDPSPCGLRLSNEDASGFKQDGNPVRSVDPAGLESFNDWLNEPILNEPDGCFFAEDAVSGNPRCPAQMDGSDRALGAILAQLSITFEGRISVIS